MDAATLSFPLVLFSSQLPCYPSLHFMIAHFFIVTYSPKQLLCRSQTAKKKSREEGKKRKATKCESFTTWIGEMCNKIISFGFFSRSRWEGINRTKCNADVFEKIINLNFLTRDHGAQWDFILQFHPTHSLQTIISIQINQQGVLSRHKIAFLHASNIFCGNFNQYKLEKVVSQRMREEKKCFRLCNFLEN